MELAAITRPDCSSTLEVATVSGDLDKQSQTVLLRQTLGIVVKYCSCINIFVHVTYSMRVLNFSKMFSYYLKLG